MKKYTQEELDLLACSKHVSPAAFDCKERLAGQKFSQACPECLNNFQKTLPKQEAS
jgi:hypothetical protein